MSKSRDLRTQIIKEKSLSKGLGLIYRLIKQKRFHSLQAAFLRTHGYLLASQIRASSQKITLQVGKTQRELDAESKTKSQTTTPLTQFSLTSNKHSERNVLCPDHLTEKAKGLLMGANLTRAMILNSAKVTDLTKKKAQTTKASNLKGHRNALLFFTANKFLTRVAKTALSDFRNHCGMVTPELRLQMGRDVFSLEQEIENLKDQLEAKTYSAYNSNTNKGYNSLTGELALIANDDSKVGITDQDLIESSRYMKDELTLSYLHFVEHQNAELTEQRDQQLQELAELGRILSVRNSPDDYERFGSQSDL